jgi:hypothetical protein
MDHPIGSFLQWICPFVPKKTLNKTKKILLQVKPGIQTHVSQSQHAIASNFQLHVASFRPFA